jgi:hypothetical protein
LANYFNWGDDPKVRLRQSGSKGEGKNSIIVLFPRKKFVLGCLKLAPLE